MVGQKIFYSWPSAGWLAVYVDAEDAYKNEDLPSFLTSMERKSTTQHNTQTDNGRIFDAKYKKKKKMK